MTFYQATNITEAFVTQRFLEASKILNAQNQTFEVFYNEALGYTCGKGYKIVDLILFKDLVATFFFKAQNQY
jgi:hypothetical protein